MRMEYDSDESGNQRQENLFFVAVPVLKILLSCSVNVGNNFIDGGGSGGVRKMAALFLDDAVESVHAGDVHATAMWMTFEHGTIRKRMISVVGSNVSTDDARRTVDDSFNIRMGFDVVNGSL